MISYIMVISLVVGGQVKEIGREIYPDLHECNIAGHVKEIEFSSKGMYNIIIECRKVIKQ
jgi:hypothetical protein